MVMAVSLVANWNQDEDRDSKPNVVKWLVSFKSNTRTLGFNIINSEVQTPEVSASHRLDHLPWRVRVGCKVWGDLYEGFKNITATSFTYDYWIQKPSTRQRNKKMEKWQNKNVFYSSIIQSYRRIVFCF